MTFNIILIVLLLSAVAIGTFDGMRAGASRQIIRLATSIAAAIVSYFVATSLYSKIDEYFKSATPEAFAKWLEGLGFIPISITSKVQYVDIDVLKHLAYIPASLVAIPVIFVLLFLVLNSLFKILHVVICGVGGLTKERNNTLTRTLGAIIGAIQALAIVGIILLPAVGAASVVNSSVTAIQKKAPESKVITVYNTYVKEYSENKILAIYDACGVGALYEGISEVSVDGKQVKMTRLAPDIANIYSEASTLSGSDWRKLTPESQEKLRDLAALIEENAYVSNVAAGAIRSLSKSYQGGSLQLVKEGYLAEAMNEAVKIFEDTSVDTLYEDLDTILTVYFILCNENVIYSIESGTDALMTALTTKDAEDKTAINRIVDVLKENERTKPILSVVTKITVSAMYGELGITEETEAMYESVKEGLTDVLTLDKESFSDETEFSAAVNESIGSTLASSGIEIEQEMIDTMSEYVVENYDELSLNADESFDTLLFYYYDAYIEYINSGTMPPELPPELSSES